MFDPEKKKGRDVSLELFGRVMLSRLSSRQYPRTVDGFPS
jgi:hypothetical protein